MPACAAGFDPPAHPVAKTLHWGRGLGLDAPGQGLLPAPSGSRHDAHNRCNRQAGHCLGHREVNGRAPFASRRNEKSDPGVAESFWLSGVENGGSLILLDGAPSQKT
jgi:hypothetical protein